MPLIRSRDLRVNIKEMGYEKGVVHTLELALDEMADLRLHMRELTELVGRCIEQIDRFVQIGDGLQRRIDEIKRVEDQNDELNG